MPKIQLAVFDMAGTTIEDENNVARAFQQALNQAGYPEVTLREANEKMGYSKPQAIGELLQIHEKDPGKITNSLIDRIHSDFVQRMVDHYSYDTSIRAKEGAEEVFAALAEMGIKVALDTGFSRAITDIILHRVGWADGQLVQATAASDEVPKGRPFSFMIQKIMRELGISDPKSVIKIGDTEVDIHEGHRAGCLMSIGVTGGAYTKEELVRHRPTHIAENLKEVLEIIQEYELSLKE